jgi:hypothetical protein
MIDLYFERFWRLLIIALFFVVLYGYPETQGFERVVSSAMVLFCLNELFVNRASQGAKE